MTVTEDKVKALLPYVSKRAVKLTIKDLKEKFAK